METKTLLLMMVYFLILIINHQQNDPQYEEVQAATHRDKRDKKCVIM